MIGLVLWYGVFQNSLLTTKRRCFSEKIRQPVPFWVVHIAFAINANTQRRMKGLYPGSSCSCAAPAHDPLTFVSQAPEAKHATFATPPYVQLAVQEAPMAAPAQPARQVPQLRLAEGTSGQLLGGAASSEQTQHMTLMFCSKECVAYQHSRHTTAFGQHLLAACFLAVLVCVVMHGGHTT